jgi:cytochrome c oxidase assembly protein subunit 15
MGGTIVPPDLMQISPWYLNFFYNPTTVQFVHRMIAWSLIVLVPTLWWWVRRSVPAPQARLASNWMIAALALQVTLGIATLLSVVALPLAAAHQAGAVLLYAACLWTTRSLGTPIEHSQLSAQSERISADPLAAEPTSAQGYSR